MLATDQWTLPPRSEELSSVRPLALSVEMAVAYESPPARNPSGTGEMADSEEPASPPEGSAEGASPRGSGINPGPMVGEDNNDEDGGEEDVDSSRMVMQQLDPWRFGA